MSLKSFLFACLLVLAPISSVFAQSTASQVLPGYLTTLGCPSGSSACFNPIGSITPVVSGSSSSGVVFKAAPGNLISLYVTSGATAGWVMIFNSTTIPGNGATTAGTASGNMVDCLSVPANSSVYLDNSYLPVEAFSVGISVAFSSTTCSTLTSSATAFIHGMVQ
jgi:hypothetical protein